MHYPVDGVDLAAVRVRMGRLRADLGLTYDALAERTGVSRRTLVALESGRTGGSLDTWFRVARALGTSLDGRVTEAETH